MPRPRIDIGVCSYRNPEKLRACLASVEQRSVLDWRLHIFQNPGPDAEEDATASTVARQFANRFDFDRCTYAYADTNIGYAGAVAEIQRRYVSEGGWHHLIYLDNDTVIQTPAWDHLLSSALDANPELGVAYPGEQPYQIPRANYIECMWGVGFAFACTRKAITEAGVFDTNIGHQEEADFAMRVRLAGYKLACLPKVKVLHDATATNDPAARERINNGVVAFVDKYNRLWCGKTQGYHSPNVLRFEDWPINSLYLEEYWKLKPELKGLNDAPEVVTLDGREYDLIRVPRLKDFYKSRII